MNVQNSMIADSTTPTGGDRLIEMVVNFPTTLCLIALVVGLLIIFIGYRFSGGYYNRKELTFSITISTIIGIFTVPLLFKAFGSQHLKHNMLALGFIFIVEIIFVAAVSAHAYEMVTVTAKEAQARLPRE
ncbi:MAG: hypothetical protein EHM72_16555, partial [Calditrichaeota bacterium]